MAGQKCSNMNNCQKKKYSAYWEKFDFKSGPRLPNKREVKENDEI